LLDSWSGVRAAMGGPGLMVSREVAEPASRIAGRGGMAPVGGEAGRGLSD